MKTNITMKDQEVLNLHEKNRQPHRDSIELAAHTQIHKQQNN
jgi:hypothetical protein